MAQIKEQLEKAVTADGWGKVVESEESYVAVLGLLRAFRPLNADQIEFYRRLSASISARINQMRAPASPKSSITSADLRKCLDAMKISSFQDFPIDPVKYSASLTSAGVAVRVQSWGLKDAEVYVDPVTTLTLVDADGKILDSKTSEVSRQPRKPCAVVFEETVVVGGGRSLEILMREKCSIFFEFKHWKAQKKKLSTRCWTFIELSELAKFGGQPVNLEIYHKPTDLHKKKLKLHSVKDLFLQCSLTISPSPC